MEDFYPFTSEDLVKFFPQMKKVLKGLDRRGEGNKALFLLQLTVELFDDVDKIREFKNTFNVKYGEEVNGSGSVSDGFLKIVGSWLEANNGTGNLKRIVEILRLNGHLSAARDFEQLLLRYTLPVSEDSNNNANGYSLSRVFPPGSEKEGAGMDSRSDSSSVEQALQNSVIVHELFKKLGPRDQKSFRLVAPALMNETFSLWRRNATLILHVAHRYNSWEKGMMLGQFMDLLQPKRILRDRKALPPSQGTSGLKREADGGRYMKAPVWGDGRSLVQTTAEKPNYKLAEVPFRSYKLSYAGRGLFKRKSTPFFCGEIETKFWQMCGPRIENLNIQSAQFDSAVPDKSLRKICERILLDTCENLQKLKISSSCSSSVANYFSFFGSGSEGDDGGNQESKNKGRARKCKFIRKQKFAVNLHTLTINAYLEEEELRQLLSLCPNLKTLNLWGKFVPIANPTLSGDFLKLDTLKIDLSHFVGSFSFFSIRKYTAMLVEKNFNCLQHLKLYRVKLSEARTTPFDLYAALAYSSISLKTLTLDFQISQIEDLKGDKKWFTELSPFSFPSLTAFTLTVNFAAVSRRYGFQARSDAKFEVKFDFGTLKGMPNLQHLDIQVKNEDKEVERSPGVADWIFKGNRSTFLSEGLAQDYFYSKEDPILCSKLKELTFFGWSLNKEDVKLLSSWFPNLTQLKAEVEGDAVAYMTNWQSLDKLKIRTQPLISLWQLRPLKEKNKVIQIFQKNIKEGMSRGQLELKEENGMLYFSGANYYFDWFKDHKEKDEAKDFF